MGLFLTVLALPPPLSPLPNPCVMIKSEAFALPRSPQDQPGARMVSSPPRARGVPWQCPPGARARNGLSPERREGPRVFDHFKLLSLALSPLIRDAGLGNWDTESCQTLETLPAHTKCQCRQLATFAVLAQLPRDLVGDSVATATSLLGTRGVVGGDPRAGGGGS